MTKQEMLTELKELTATFEDFNKIKSLFSEDEAERAVARLLKIVNNVRFLLSLEGVKDVEIDESEPYFRKPIGNKRGELVAVKPVGSEYEGKTYIGFLIGELSMSVQMAPENGTLKIKFSGMGNPCIFIPETGTVVMGYESWWSEIKSPEHFRQITDQDIENTWYVKLWKEIHSSKDVNNVKTDPTGAGSQDLQEAIQT